MTNLATFISMSFVLFTFSRLLTAAAILLCIPMFIVHVRMGRKRYRLEFERTEKLRKSFYAANLLTDRMYAAERMSFGLWEHFFDKWRNASEAFLRQDTGLKKHNDLATIAISLLSQFSMAGATGYIVFVHVWANRDVTIGDIILYSSAFTMSLTCFREAIVGFAGMYENILFIKNYKEFEEEKTLPEAGGNRIIEGEVYSIEFDNVSFKYNHSSEYVLKNVSFIFNKGESYMLVGANGAGKTTIFKLIIRLYEPTEGRILLNGVDVREFNVDSLRKAIGVLFQRFVPFAVSAAENIGVGNIPEVKDIEKIRRSARLANADVFINELPDGYGTMLSTMFEGGRELSWGQWQRICLARLFMKESPVILLDEPTASIDVETQSRVFEEIRNISGKGICIFACHHVFQSHFATKIVVLKDGFVCEAGSYFELLEKDGEFVRLKRLFELRNN